MTAADPAPQATSQADDIYSLRFGDELSTSKNGVWRQIGRYLQRHAVGEGPVVDIACDQGYFIRNIASVDKWAVDVRDMRPHLPPDVTFVQCDGLHLDEHLPGGFATAFMSNYLEHLPSGDAVIAQLAAVHKILQPSGRVIILQPNIRLVGGAYWHFIDHRTALTERSVAEAAELAGFRTVKVITRFLPYTTISRLPQQAWLVRAYLAFRPAWLLLGKQSLYVGEKV